MMKFFMFMIFVNFMLNIINKYLIQLFYQNLLYFLTFMLMINMSLKSKMMMIYYNMGGDLYSLGLIMLSIWILSLMIMVKVENFYQIKIYMNILNMLLLLLLLCFMSLNTIMFYIFFESSLIPVFMLIMGWGFQIDRIQAGFYMMLYTLMGSLPLFYIIIYIFNNNNTLMMSLINLKMESIYIYFMMMIAFLVKMPMYFLHLWLPKAHVEAPLVGSMILAGVMLKLGSYGLMRFMMMMMKMCIKFNKFVIIISLMGGIYSSLICLCQIDMKMLVAYSSVVHMSILMSGLLTMYNLGYFGGYLMMIAHGLCSSGLFCLVNMNYERLGSRSLLINKGMVNFFPSLSLMWFLLCSSNLSFPPSLNLFSEIMLLNSLMIWEEKLMIIIILILFFSASYSLYLYSYSQQGNYNNLIYFMKGIMVSEFMLLILHWLPLNLMFLIMYLFN